jgi:6-phosphofructokinase 1
MDAVRAGRFGEMVALQAGEIVLLPLAAALRQPKLLDPGLLELASVFFG